MKTWAPKVAADVASILTPAQREAIEGLQIRATDEADAADGLAEVLGIEFAACCEDGDDPCPECAIEAREKADERSEDAEEHRRDLIREDDEDAIRREADQGRQ